MDRKYQHMKSTLFLIFTLASACLMSQDALITERPGQTDSPNSIEKGGLQIETGLFFQRTEISRNVSQERSVTPTSLFRIGLLKKLELRVLNEIVKYKVIDNSRSEEISNSSGTENMQLGFKYQLSQNGSKTTIGALAHMVVPTGSRGIGNQKYGIISKLSLSHNLEGPGSIGLNAGYNNTDLRFADEGLVRDQDGNFSYTLIYGHSINSAIGIYVEAFGDYLNFEDWENGMDAGISYLLNDNLQFDYSFGWGLSLIMNFHSLGVSLRINRD